MRFRCLFPVLAASLGWAGCTSAPAKAPAPQAQVPAVSPAVAAEKLGGFWLLSVQRGGQSIDHSLHIQLTAGELVGSLTGPDGNAREISKVTLAGDQVSWEIGGQGAAQKFEGKLKGASSMEGTIKMVRGQRGSSRGGAGQGSGRSGDESGDGPGASPPPDGGGGRGGGGGGYSGRGGGGRGGRGDGGRGGVMPQVTWRAFKSVEPPPEATPAPSKPAG